MRKITLIILLSLFFIKGSYAQVSLSVAGFPLTLPAGWVLGSGSATPTGAVAIVDSEIRLTTAAGNESGHLYYNTAENVTACGQFQVDFDFKIVASGSGTADGIAFFFINPLTSFVSGGGLGLPSPLTGLVFTLDTYDNDADGLNPEVELFGYATPTVYAEGGTSPPRLAPTIHEATINNGAWHHVKITYNGGVIKVYYNGSATATLTGNFAITTAGYFGFSSSTGGVYSTQYVKDIYITSNSISPINGADSLCVGSSITLSDSTAGGTWASSAASVGSVSTAGVLHGLSSGTTTVTYSYGTGCSTTYSVTVDAIPTATVSAASPICSGGNTNVIFTGTPGASVHYNINGTGSYTAVIGATGTVAVPTGTLYTNVTYNLVGAVNGPCSATLSGSAVITVSPPLTTAITGSTSICQGFTTTLSSTPTGGTWSSSASGHATIDPVSGVAAGINLGTETITYAAPTTGCIAVTTVTVNPMPSPLVLTTLCQGAMALASGSSPETATGGTWTITPTSTATVAATGVITGLSAGAAMVTYTLPAGCFVTGAVTVNPLPSPIFGTDSVCVGLVTTLSDTSVTTGVSGTWSSGNPAIASVTGAGAASGAATDAVAGVSSSTVAITYTLPTGCSVADTITVHAAPSVITGPTTVCVNYTDTLADLSAGGTWSAAPVAYATIDAVVGVLGGQSQGTSLVTYTLPSGGCQAYYSVLVNPVPGPITGPDSVCVGLTISLSSTVPTGGTSFGDTWSSSSTSVASVDPSGVVYGSSSGVADITFTLTSGCYVTDTVTVNLSPAPVTGPSAVCVTTSVSYTDTPTGGSWSTSPSGFATINALTGTLSGLSQGITIVTYTLPVGACMAYETVTVNPVPAPITGADSVCVGLVTTLGSSPAGTWSDSPTGIATIDPSTGALTGIAKGLTEVTFTLPTGCLDSVQVRVNALPAPIAGPVAVCTGLSITLTDDTLGGVWSATPATTGTINANTGVLLGTLTGPTANTVTVTYTIPTGCTATEGITVNPLPAPILGPDTVCYGLTATITDATTGGTWSSEDPATASVDASGNVTGVAVGSTHITYTLGSGCIETILFTVNPLPAPVTGPGEVCVNASITMNDVTPLGTWSTAPMPVATINASGSLTGVSAGTVTAIYTLPTSCRSTALVTVNQIPNPIGGTLAVCEDGGTTVLTEATPPGPGTWSITPATAATITATGTVTGISSAAGPATVTYTLPVTNCYITATLPVNPLPAPITGSPTVCANSTTILHDATTPGTWTAAPITIATVVGATGAVTGVSAGTVTVTYTLNTTGCDVTYTMTVEPQPAAVITALGDTMLCPGSFVDLTANTGAGLTYQWSNGGGAISGATTSSYIDTLAGSYKVKVTNTLGCSLTSPAVSITVNSVTAAAITSAGGATITCFGTPLLLSATTGPGLSYQWLLNGSSIPGANSSSYGVTDSSGGYTVVISNTVGCSRLSNTITITVNPTPAGMVTASGVTTFCNGGMVLLTADTGTGYTYQWYGTSAGLIPGATGISYSAGTTDNFYVTETNTYGCSASSAPVSVIAILGTDASITTSSATVFCSGGSAVLTTTPSGSAYQWYNNGVLIPGATDDTYTDTESGNFTVSITNSAGCTDTSTTAEVITAVPVPVVVPLSPTSFCWGGGVSLTVNVVSGGSGLTYQWYLDGTMIPGATSPVYNTSVPGDYSCSISGSCITATVPVTVTEHPLPNPVIVFNGSELSVGSYYVTYQWYNGTIAIPGATTASITPAENATYAVAVTDTNGCQAVSDEYVLSGLGVHDVNQLEASIYPNPAQTMLHVSSSAAVSARISSIDGKLLITREQARNTDIDISGLADGVYLIVLYDTNGVQVKTEKVIKATN